MKHTAKQILHWEKPFTRSLFHTALPIAIQNLVAASLHIVDGLMIAGMENPANLAGVTQAGRYSFLFNLFLFGAASGSTMFISQFWGQKNQDGIRRVMSLCLRITVGIAFVFMLGALFFPTEIMSLLTNEGDSRLFGAQYLSIVAFNYLIAGIDIVFSNTLRATERPTVAMLAGCAAILTNTVLNYGLIYGKLGLPEMGVQGAAIATVVAAGVSLCVNLGYTYLKRQPGAIRPREMKMPERAFAKDYIKRVLPVVLNEGIWALGIATYAAFYGHLGDDAINAMSVFSNIDQLMTVLVFGMVNATAIMIGKEIGAGNIDKAFLTAKRMLIAVVSVSACTGLLLICVRHPLLSLYTKLSPATLQTAASIMLIAGIVMPFRHINTVNIVGILRAGGDTIYSMLLDGGSVWLIGVPCVAIATFVLKLPMELVYLSMMVEEFFKICLSMPRFLSGKWINNLTQIGAKEA